MAARAAGLPLPHLTVRGITIGTTEDIKVGKVTVTPDLWTLFDPTRVIKSIEIDGLVITHKAVGRIPAWLPLDARAGEPSQPPALRLDDPRHSRNDPKYAEFHPEDLPATECLKDTIDRFLPYAQENIGPAIRSGKRVLLVAHGNTLRGLIKYVERISDKDIADLNIPTAIPMVYEFEDDMKPIRRYYLGDQDAVKKAAEAVAAQSKAKG